MRLLVNKTKTLSARSDTVYDVNPQSNIDRLWVRAGDIIGCCFIDWPEAQLTSGTESRDGPPATK